MKETEEDKTARLTTAAEMIRSERRYYNNLLKEHAENKKDEYNSEDLMRLVGTLEAAYNHALAAIASDGDVYCLLKHISYAIILEGELEDQTPKKVGALYDLMSVISNGRVEPCSACKKEESEDGEEEDGEEEDGEETVE